jgi:hypothetical protein
VGRMESDKNEFTIMWDAFGIKVSLYGYFVKNTEEKTFTAVANKIYQGTGETSTKALIDLLKRF